MSVTLDEADMRAFVRVLSQLFGIQLNADAAAAQAQTAALIQQLQQQVQRMSDNINARIDALTSATASLEQRVSAQDAKLTTAQQERDAAVAELQAAKDQLAALPHDTSAQEKAIDAVIARLNAIDAAPVPAPAGGDTTAPTVGNTQPAPGTPDATPPADPNAPTGTEVKL